jgi:hypothetical protein
LQDRSAALFTEIEEEPIKCNVTQAVTIRGKAEYGGVRVRMAAPIAGARVPIQVDVGFGDAVTPGPIEIEYPTLFEAHAPHVGAYLAETVIAEKFEALVIVGAANSRLKDLYDLWLIAQTFGFDQVTHADAVRGIFDRRRTPLPTQTPTVLVEAFAAEKAAQWRASLGRERLAAALGVFDTIVANLRAFLLPLVLAAPGARHSWRAGGQWHKAGGTS